MVRIQLQISRIDVCVCVTTRVFCRQLQRAAAEEKKEIGEMLAAVPLELRGEWLGAHYTAGVEQLALKSHTALPYSGVVAAKVLSKEKHSAADAPPNWNLVQPLSLSFSLSPSHSRLVFTDLYIGCRMSKRAQNLHTHTHTHTRLHDVGLFHPHARVCVCVRVCVCENRSR
jgi:hypothetical protein